MQYQKFCQFESINIPIIHSGIAMIPKKGRADRLNMQYYKQNSQNAELDSYNLKRIIH
jgi:hypothetical protein